MSQNHQPPGVMSMPAPAPENVDHSSNPFAAGSKPHLIYKCLLNQHAQKLKKPPPTYQTQNEGSEHLPMFRSTVLVDGVSYTSSNTFHHRKNADMDVARIAYIAITHKAKTDALDFIQEDKIFCKSVMAEFAAKKNIRKPVYETTQVEASVPIFRSNLLFNGDTYPGDGATSKKEAEQLVARFVIIKFLASESGTDMADIVNSKVRQYQEITSIQIGSNALGAQAACVVTQPPTPHVSTVSSLVPVTLSSADPIHPPSQQVSTGPINPVIPLVTQQPIVAPIMPFVALTPVVAEASDKKRSRTSRRNARKKMTRLGMPMIPAATQVLPFSS